MLERAETCLLFELPYNFTAGVNLAAELDRLRMQRTAGAITEAAYYRVVAHLLDSSPDAPPSTPEDAVVTCARRMEALLEDRLGASGSGLAEKAGSARDRLPAELLESLREIARLSEAIGRDLEYRLADPTGFLARCDHTLVDLLHHLPPAKPTTFLKGLAPGPMPHHLTRGIVQKIRPDKGDRCRHTALLEVDGRILQLESPAAIQIARGDHVVLLGLDSDKATSYRNESTGATGRFAPESFWKVAAVGGVVALAGLAAVVLAATMGVENWREGWGLWKYLLFALVGAALAFIGLLVTVVGIMVHTFQPSIDAALRSHSAAPIPPPPPA